jgi:hypothetical protein
MEGYVDRSWLCIVVVRGHEHIKQSGASMFLGSQPFGASLDIH